MKPEPILTEVKEWIENSGALDDRTAAALELAERLVVRAVTDWLAFDSFGNPRCHYCDKLQPFERDEKHDDDCEHLEALRIYGFTETA